MQEKILRTVLQLVTNEITCDILNKHSLRRTDLKELFENQIDSERVDKLYRIISSNGPNRNPWKECSRLFGDLTFNGNKFFMRGNRRNTSPYMISDNLLIDGYKKEVFFEVIRILLDCDLLNVNDRGQNDNTVLHLIVSLPTETENALEFKIKLLKLLIKASADCSLQNAQGMSPLHIVAGSHLFDSHEGYELLSTTGLLSRWNTEGRYQILQLLEPNVTYLERGRHGNSILHEWVISSSTMEKLSTEEKQICEFIISQAKVPLYSANEYICTALHYAFSKDVLEFLCQYISETDTARLSSHGDTAALYIVKYGILRQLANSVDFEETLATELNVSFSSEHPKPHIGMETATANRQCSELFQYMCENNRFDVDVSDGNGKSCLDYLLLFIKALFKHRRESFEVLFTVKSWIEILTKDSGAFNTTAHREKSISHFLCVLFDAGDADMKVKEMLVECTENLFNSGADPNNIECYGTKALEYCCVKATSGCLLHKRVVKLLCENGAQISSSHQCDTELQLIITNTRPKPQVKIQIQSVRYCKELDDLSRVLHPERIDSTAFRYNKDFIGKGAMSVVFLAIDEKNRRELALKRIDKTSITAKEMEIESKVLRNSEQNPNIINFYQIEETREFYYIGIELMDGDLKDLVGNKKHELDEKEELMRKLAADMVGGLAYLHKNDIIHRDIKPGNILYRESPELMLKLADFGLAKHLTTASFEESTVLATNASNLCGTRGWMAPELISKKLKSPTKETDIFALGLVLHFLFSKGFHPFLSKEESLLKTLSTDNFQAHMLELGITKNEMKIHHDLSSEQIHLVKILLRNNPKERHGSSGLLKAHCYFWSSVKKVAFICAVGDQPEVAAPASYPSSTFGSNLNESTFGRSFRSYAGWDQSVSTILYQEMSKRKRYNTSSVTDLVRFFRNAYAHYEERSTSSKKEIMDDEILKRLPEFFVTVWMEVKSQKWDEPESQREKIMRVLNEQD